MGIINFGLPIKIAAQLKDLLELNTFFEGGTYMGKTALAMSSLFGKVLTVEKSPILYEKASRKLFKVSNIELLKADTRDILSSYLETGFPTLFWLIHWSGGDTYGADDECPLLSELNIIFEKSKSNHAILIDDARLFMARHLNLMLCPIVV